MSSDTRTALLDSAERAARTRGFDGFSYADLSQDVGIRKASIHHHFPTKASLSVAIMQRYYSDFQTACSNIDKTKRSGGARLAALIDRYRQALDGGKSLCLCVAFSTSRQSLPEDVINQISRFRAMVIAWLQDVFASGKSDGSISGIEDTHAEATAALSLLEGAQLTARVEENPVLFENATGLLQKRLK